MKNKYYNKWEIVKILETVGKNPWFSKEKYEEYLKEYPYDYSTRCHYASNLIILGLFDEAEKIIDEIEKEYPNNPDFYTGYNQKKIHLLNYFINYNRINIYCFKGEYQKAIDQYEKSYYLFDDFNFGILLFYCKFKCGLIDETASYKKPYIFKQITNYNEKDMIIHTKKHINKYENIYEGDCTKQAVFFQDFPLEKIIEEVKKYFSKDKALHYGFFNDDYFFRYDDCGKDNNRITNFFKVICFHNTPNIITIYPDNKGRELPHVDLNYLKEEKSLTKRISQIDKFNQRYKR